MELERATLTPEEQKQYEELLARWESIPTFILNDGKIER